jgi:hypothetical protein
MGFSSGLLRSYYKGKIKVKFTLEQATKAQRGSRGIALLFSLTSVLDGGAWSTPRPGHFTPGKDPVPVVQEAVWAAGPVWTGAEISPPGPLGNYIYIRMVL